VPFGFVIAVPKAALWPSALHVPLGLALALPAIRLHRRGPHVAGTAAALGGSSVEQVVLALPLVVWLLAGTHRRRATVRTTRLVGVVVTAYALLPGDHPRIDVPLGQRVTSMAEGPQWYAVFPAVGVGIHSGALAVAWAFPTGLCLLAAAVLAVAYYADRQITVRRSGRCWPGECGGLPAADVSITFAQLQGATG
jgi:hypothetical protein